MRTGCGNGRISGYKIKKIKNKIAEKCSSFSFQNEIHFTLSSISRKQVIVWVLLPLKTEKVTGSRPFLILNSYLLHAFFFC